MPKLTRHNSFSELKSASVLSRKAAPVNEQAHFEHEAFMNRLKRTLANKSPIRSIESNLADSILKVCSVLNNH